MEKAYLITENTNFELLKNSIADYDRLYFWDAYCEHNLISLIKNEWFIKNIVSFWLPLTLTTPITSEKNLSILKDFIESMKNFTWLEVVINDYWVLSILEKNFPNIKKIRWNFVCWQNKDPFLKIFKDKDIHKQITIDNWFYYDYIKRKDIDFIEIYNVFQGFQIKNPYNISLYYPYTVYSINRYCPTKLVYDKKNYLTVVEECDGCLWKIPPNFNMDLKMKTDSSKNFFRGNKQFYENTELNTDDKIKRIIYNYDLLW